MPVNKEGKDTMAGTIGTIPDFTPSEGEPVTPTPPAADQTPPAEPAADEVIEPETTPPAPPAADAPGTETIPPADDAPPDEGDGEPGDAGAAPDDPKAVEGLKSEAQLLKDEIVELRRVRRNLRGGGEPVEPPAAGSARTQPSEPAVDISDVEPEDVDRIERVLKAKGYVKKDQLAGVQAATMQDTEVDAFLERHPELKPENDPDDLRWSAFKRELTLFAQPKDRATFRKVLERAYKGVAPAAAPPTRTPDQQRGAIRRAGAGSGGGGHVTTTPRPSGGGIPSHLRGGMKGFSQKELDEM
jgi:hypothetical protein